MKKIAVVGSGISGLSAAWLLQNHSASNKTSEVHLFESSDYLGGHSNTVDVTLEGHTAPVDTGFLVHNNRTYPHLIELFKLLGIDSYESDMSFSVKVLEKNIEWAGSNIDTLFIQRKNIFSYAFLRMIQDILRFNKKKFEYLEKCKTHQWSLGELLIQEKFSNEFRDWYLIPMGACIWSTPTSEMLRFPGYTFIQFCENHGLLQVADRPQWKTIKGGSREYVKRMAKSLAHIYLNEPVLKVSRKNADGKMILVTKNQTLEFDEVILATHTDISLKIIENPTDTDREILSAIDYQENVAYLHYDKTFLPENKKAWSAWNYETDIAGPNERAVMVSYYINNLQSLPFHEPILVTLNPTREPSAHKLIKKIVYHHPVFTEKSTKAQEQLLLHQGLGGLWFAGAWTRYGFHEDGILSGINVANALGAFAPWQKEKGSL